MFTRFLFNLIYRLHVHFTSTSMAWPCIHLQLHLHTCYTHRHNTTYQAAILLKYMPTMWHTYPLNGLACGMVVASIAPLHWNIFAKLTFHVIGAIQVIQMDMWMRVSQTKFIENLYSNAIHTHIQYKHIKTCLQSQTNLYLYINSVSFFFSFHIKFDFKNLSCIRIYYAINIW